MPAPQNEIDKVAYLGKTLNLNTDLIRAANLGEEKMHDIFNRAVLNERFQRRYVAPAGWASMALFIAGMSMTYMPVTPAVSSAVTLLFMPVFGFFMVGDRIINKRDGLRHEIRRAAEHELLRVKADDDKNQPSHPAP